MLVIQNLDFRALPGLLFIRVKFGNYKQNLGFFGTNSGLWAMWRPCPKFGTFLLALYLISASKFQIWEYPKCWVIPETSGLPDVSGNTRYDTPGLPEISGNTRYYGLPATR